MLKGLKNPRAKRKVPLILGIWKYRILKLFMKELSIKTTKQEEFIDITREVERVVSESKIEKGICYLYTPHTTSGITINENADPDVLRDIKTGLDSVVPDRGDWLHSEGNSPAHIKSSLIGPTLFVFVEGGTLALGTWQGIYFCEFDGPRTRKLWVKVVKD